ncbi:MAG: radical SAM protein [Deltaproteobacteria bacterium]|nr:radical SAM protein [Deltaproteobacteria bacterium]
MQTVPDGVDRALWAQASALRREYWSNSVFLRGIVEFSSHCRQNCLYCGLRNSNKKLPRYRLERTAILQAAGQVQKLGFGTLVLQAGEDDTYPAGELAEIIAEIKGELGLAVTISLGERSEADYRLWRKAGADRYLLKLETLNARLYARLRPGNRLEDRLNCLRHLADLGYETGTGLIAGLPSLAALNAMDAPANNHANPKAESTVETGSDPANPKTASTVETGAELDESIARLAELKPDMLSISPFVPHPDTPLHAFPACAPSVALRCMAVARLHMPYAHIPVTSALGLAGDQMRLTALAVGDVLMPSLTPEEVREAYAIYPGKNAQHDDPLQRAAAMRDLVKSSDFAIGAGAGGAWRKG